MNILTFFRDRSRERARKLYDEGRELVDSGLHEDALKVARKLRKVRYTGAFEIEALAYSGLERHEDAVRVLREGLTLAPSVWLNWQMLGNCLSNLERYDEAFLAYDRAQACPESELATIDLNRAIVEMRRREWGAALRYLEGIHAHASESMRLKSISVRVDTLRCLDRDDEAEELGVRTLNQWLDSNATDDTDSIGAIALFVGEIRLERGVDRTAIHSYAIEWWRRTHHEPMLWLIREGNLVRSPNARSYRLSVHGIIAPERRDDYGDCDGYWCSVAAVADSPEQAFELFLEIREPEEGVTLALGEATPDEADDNPHGVYFVSGRALYKETD